MILKNVEHELTLEEKRDFIQTLNVDEIFDLINWNTGMHHKGFPKQEIIKMPLSSYCPILNRLYLGDYEYRLYGSAHTMFCNNLRTQIEQRRLDEMVEDCVKYEQSKILEEYSIH